MSRQPAALTDSPCITEKHPCLGIEAHHRMPDGKLIVTMQTCMRCGRTFRPKRGRTHCPECQGLLRSKTMILNVQ